MKHFDPLNRLFLALLLAASRGISPAASSNNVGYVQVNLASDIASNAPHLDTRLVNAWGVVAGPRGVWVNDNGSGLVTAYTPSGVPFPKAISVPAPGGGAGTPSGLAFNDSFKFILTNGMRHEPADLLIATEDGTVAAWNAAITGSNAVIMVDNSGAGAVYKGLAIVRDTNNAPNLYVADFHNNRLDMFDSQFQFVRSFTDAGLPAFFAPFNVRNLRGRVLVSFAKQKLPDAHDDEAGPGNGYIDIFDTDGTLLRSFAAQGALDSPWGMAVAPGNFGRFSHALLLGNFGDGTINAFDLLTGKSLGPLLDPSGNVIVVQGLWGLAFDRDEIFEHESDFFASRLYFTAGPNGESDGLLGYLRPVSIRAPHAR